MYTEIDTNDSVEQNVILLLNVSRCILPSHRISDITVCVLRSSFGRRNNFFFFSRALYVIMFARSANQKRGATERLRASGTCEDDYTAVMRRHNVSYNISRRFRVNMVVGIRTRQKSQARNPFLPETFYNPELVLTGAVVDSCDHS